MRALNNVPIHFDEIKAGSSKNNSGSSKNKLNMEEVVYTIGNGTGKVGWIKS